MANERRAYPRRAVHWEARVTAEGAAEQRMTIRDFCAGGLFLEPRSKAPESVDAAPWPDWLTIRFEDPSSGDVCQAEAGVVRHITSGLAVSFDRPRLDVVTILAAIAEGQADTPAPQAGRGADRQSANEAFQVFRREALGFAERVMPVFTGHSIDALATPDEQLKSPGDIKSVQQIYLSWRQRENELIAGFVSRLSERIDDLLSSHADRGSAASDSTTGNAESVAELELIDTDEFEEWLNRSEIVSQAESVLAGPLERLSRRLAHVTGCALDQTNNPVGPAVLTDILSESLPIDQLPTPISRQLYRLFARDVLDSLADFYQVVNEALGQRDILPALEQERPEIRSLGGSQRHRWRPRSSIESLYHGDGVFIAEDQATGPAVRRSGHVQGEIPVSLDQLDHAEHPGAPDRVSPSAVTPATEGVEESRHGDDTAVSTRQASRWVDIERMLRSLQSAAASRSLNLADEAAAPALSGAETEASVVASTSSPNGGTQPAHEVLAQLLNGSHAPALGELAEPQRQRVEIVADWFQDIISNPTSTALLQRWSHSLAHVALERELQSGDLLADEHRPLHVFLNQWDRAGLALAATEQPQQGRLGEQIDAVLEHVRRAHSEQPGCIAEAASQLSALADSHLQTRAANLQRITDQCEGSKRLEQARAAVSLALDERLAGHRIPKILNDFICDHWHHVLVLIRLRSGTQSEHWQRALAVVDRLLIGLGTSHQEPRPVPEMAKVFGFITKQLEAFGRYSQDCGELVEAMRAYIDADGDGDAGTKALSMVRAREFATQQTEDGTSDSYWLGLLKLVQPGQWFLFQESAQADMAPLRLQWVNDDQTRFVFADRAGAMPYEFRRPELVAGLESGRFRLIEDLDAPLTQRQWRRKIESAQETIADLAARDTTTGLLNRKALVRELQRLTAGTTSSQLDHAIASFRCPELVGQHDPERVSHVGATLAEGLNEGDRVARSADQGFVVFLNGRSTARAEILVEEKRRALTSHARRLHADAEDVSVGLVGCRLDGRKGPDELLHIADKARDEVSQASGGVKIVRADERDLATFRTNITRAARLDAALEEGNLQLRAQRIQPVGESQKPANPLREILIAIGSGEAGEQLLSPAEFIPAAERFGRMADVDRWVIRRVVEWCRDHPRQARGVDAFTINLAGASLQDASLADYLQEKLARTEVPADKLCFELSQPVVAENLARAADLLVRLRQQGVRFALADAVTGQGTFHFLNNLPIDYIKIDGSFVRDLAAENADATLVRTINDLGHYLQRETIAEHVENETILERLEALGVDYVQGYGIGYPEPLNVLPPV